MKIITILFLFISSLSLINAQSSDIDSVKALKVDRNIVTLSQSTKDKFDSNGLTFYINQYYNVSDWNNDGLGDLVVMVGYNDALNDDNYLSLFLLLLSSFLALIFPIYYLFQISQLNHRQQLVPFFCLL